MELEGIRWLSRGKPAGNFFEKIASLHSKISSRHHFGKRGFKHKISDALIFYEHVPS